ncbi:uncharacterized protein PG986_000524 [Apiospora aurea]|uniref:Uncharacterized protein n=1 Tax=Apiospora aurea TaxID=335848 RepID=A0ABR1QU83_9PEZI
MHSLFTFLLLGFAPLALGNFWVFYEVDDNDTYYTGYKFFNESYPSCDEVGAAERWSLASDVSGGQRGVRVTGDDRTLPDVFEANVGTLHYTIYKDRGYGIFDTHGTQHGFCQSYNAIPYFCVDINWYGTSAFHCNSDYDAAQINVWL